MLERVSFFPDDSSQFTTFYDKLKTRAPIVLATVGGSITAGNRIQQSKSYGHVLLEWLNSKFPTTSGSNHTYVNVGVPAHSSLHFHFCLKHVFNQRARALSREYLTVSDVDLWILDTAANDIILDTGPARWSHLEATVRSILLAGGAPTLLFVYFAAGYNGHWSNTESDQQRVATHYGIAAISWTNFILNTGGYEPHQRGHWLVDGRTHPTEEGHALAALMLKYVLMRALNTTTTTSTHRILSPMKGGYSDDPAPICEHLTASQESLKVLSNRGFTWGGVKGKSSSGLITFTPDAEIVITFDTTEPNTRIFLTLFKSWTCTRTKPSFCPGIARLKLDNTSWTTESCNLNKKISVPGPVDLGVAVGQGKHTVRVISVGKKGGVALGTLYGHRE
eukprot:8336803-Pyramimonas_sp.AAC.1